MFEKAKQKITLQKQIKNVERNFRIVMAQVGCYNKLNKTLTLTGIQKTSYGFYCKMFAPVGLALSEIEKHISALETALKGQFIYKVVADNEYAEVQIVKESLIKHNSKPYEPYEVKPYEMYCGVSIDGSPVVFDLSICPHVLISGQQRRGKNGALDHALTAWINNCYPKEIMFYMFQCSKNELIKYKWCEHVYAYIEGEEENGFQIMLNAMNHIREEIKRRKSMFEDMVKLAESKDNIYWYNQSHKGRELPYIYIIIDEFPELMPKDLDTKAIKEVKSGILQQLQAVAQFGGTYGIEFIVMHQKPQKELMPSFLKNMASVRICFGFEDRVCCAITLGDAFADKSLNLPPRKAYYVSNEVNGYLWTTDLKGAIKKYIRKSIVPNHHTFQEDHLKVQKQSEPVKPTEKTGKGVQVINDYDWQPPKEGIKVIDMTKPSNKTEKPRKGRVIINDNENAVNR